MDFYEIAGTLRNRGRRFNPAVYFGSRSQVVKFLLSSLVLLTSFTYLPALGQIDSGKPVPRLEPEYALSDQSNSSAMGRIYKIEAAFFGHPYDKENLHQRLSRLENNVFGNASYDSLNDRLDRLERALGKGIPLKVENPKTAPVTKTKQVVQKDTPDKKFANLLNAAQADISLKRYHAAAEELMNAIQINPSSSIAFRQLGDVLVELKDNEGAQEAYKACFENDPFGENGKYAKTKMLSLSARRAKSKLGPHDSPETVTNTVGTMNRQVTDYTTRMRAEGQRNSDWKLYSGDLEINRIRRETDQWLLDARSYSNAGGLPFGGRSGGRGGYRYRGGGGGGGFNGYGGRDISDLGYLRSNWVRTDSRRQALNAQREAAERSRHFSESAANLKDQLSRPRKNGQPNLRSLGTNVYVRYYGDDNPSSGDDKIPEDPALELKAKPQSLK